VKKEGMKTVRPPDPHQPVEDPNVTLEAPRVRIASKEQFEKAQKKTSKLHSGLFRRLAK
jgi:hypothetical protein